MHQITPFFHSTPYPYNELTTLNEHYRHFFGSKFLGGYVPVPPNKLAVSFVVARKQKTLAKNPAYAYDFQNENTLLHEIITRNILTFNVNVIIVIICCFLCY